MSLVLLLIAGAAFVVVLAMPLWRLSPRGGGAEWALAWSTLFASGLMLRLAEAVPDLRFLYPAMGTVFAGLLFAGARRYAETALPRSFWPLLGTLAATRAVLVMVAPPLVTMLGSVAVISTAAALSAREIGRMRGGRRGGPAEGLLIVGLLALIPTSSVYEWTKFAGADLEFGFFLWLVSGGFVAGTQIASIFEQYRTELETRLVERSEQLRASLARIEEQQRLVAIGTLAAGIAHQINNPIGAIAAAAEYALIARDDKDAASIHEDALVTALEEARRCGRIVRSVLQFARDQPMAKWIECMNTVVVRASEPVRGYVVERGGRLGVKLTDEPLPVRMSPIDVEQVVVNLIRNAAESRKQGANVDVETLRDQDDACLLVSDDGNGIDPLLRGRVFEPFFTTRLAEGGSGLGLSVVHGIVSDHGGRLEIESRPDGGTRVRVRLPIAIDSAAPMS